MFWQDLYFRKYLMSRGSLPTYVVPFLSSAGLKSGSRVLRVMVEMKTLVPRADSPKKRKKLISEGRFFIKFFRKEQGFIFF